MSDPATESLAVEPEVNMKSGDADENKWKQIKEELLAPRFRVIFVIMFLSFGLQFILGTPASIGTGENNTIQSHFQTNNKKYNQQMNQALFSAISYPNVVLAMFGGMLADKYLGLRVTTVLGTSLIFSGSVLFWIGVVFTQYIVLFCGALLVGFGLETISVCESTYVYRWFHGSRSYALAYAITLTLNRSTSALNLLILPRIAERFNPATAVFAPCIASFISVFAAIFLWYLDSWGVKRKLFPPQNVGENKGRIPSFKEILHQSPQLWFLCFFCLFSWGCMSPFNGIARNYFEVKYKISGKQAAAYMSLSSLVAIPAGLTISVIVDRVGRYVYWHIGAAFILVLIQVFILTTNIPPYIVTVCTGFFSSFIISSLWPSIPFVCSPNVVSFCYGLIFSIQSIGLATFPLITGTILKHYTPPIPPGEKVSPLPELKGYYLCSGLFVFNGLVAFTIAIVVLLFDKYHGQGIMSANAETVREFIEKRRVDEVHFIEKEKSEKMESFTADTEPMMNSVEEPMKNEPSDADAADKPKEESL